MKTRIAFQSLPDLLRVRVHASGQEDGLRWGAVSEWHVGPAGLRAGSPTQPGPALPGPASAWLGLPVKDLKPLLARAYQAGPGDSVDAVQPGAEFDAGWT